LIVAELLPLVGMAREQVERICQRCLRSVGAGGEKALEEGDHLGLAELIASFGRGHDHASQVATFSTSQSPEVREGVGAHFSEVLLDPGEAVVRYRWTYQLVRRISPPIDFLPILIGPLQEIADHPYGIRATDLGRLRSAFVDHWSDDVLDEAAGVQSQVFQSSARERWVGQATHTLVGHRVKGRDRLGCPLKPSTTGDSLGVQPEPRWRSKPGVAIKVVAVLPREHDVSSWRLRDPMALLEKRSRSGERVSCCGGVAEVEARHIQFLERCPGAGHDVATIRPGPPVVGRSVPMS
jgi:hypothetical protein